MAMKLGGQPVTWTPYPGLWGVFKWAGDADERSGSVFTMKSTMGASKHQQLVNGLPVIVKFDIQANPPVFDKNYFTTLGCIANVAH